MRMGKRYESKAKIFGWPVVSIAMGPHGSEIHGHARGLIAIGDISTGGIALGGIARGVVALGGLAVGVCAFGGGAVGLISACGGFGISSGIAVGGAAIGTIAIGGGAVGLIAQGGGALGLYTRSGLGVSPASAAVFDRFKWFFGSWPPPRGALASQMQLLVPAAVPILLSVVLSTVMGMLALLRSRNTDD
jgi:hypothetical protein